MHMKICIKKKLKRVHWVYILLNVFWQFLHLKPVNHLPCKSARKDASISSFPLSTWSSLLITSDQVAVSTNNMPPRWINTMSQRNLFSVTWIWFSFVGQHSTQVFFIFSVLHTTSTNSCLLWICFFSQHKPIPS